MSKAAVFTIKLEADLRADFLAEAARRPASWVVRELMRGYVDHQREKREHTAFLQRKFDAARESVRGGLSRSNEDVEADFAARRIRLSDQT